MFFSRNEIKTYREKTFNLLLTIIVYTEILTKITQVEKFNIILR